MYSTSFELVICLDVFIPYPLPARPPGPTPLRENAGFVLRRRSLNKAPFYFSRLLAFERT